MGSMQINFAEVEGSFEPLPEGAYQVLVEKVEVRESKSSDFNYLNWELVVQDDEHEGRRLWMITSLSPKALFRLKDVFGALGFDVESEDFDLVWDEDVAITTSSGPLVLEPDLAGMAATAIVHNEVYDNKERNKVDDLRAPESETSGNSAPKSSSSSSSSKASSGAKKAGSSRRALR